MKKKLLLIAVAFGVTAAFAQDSLGLKSKKGERILPEKDDWALSIDAAPILTYFGHFLSNAGGNSPTWGYSGTPLAITGKYFKDERTAYRALIRLGIGSTTTNAYSQQDGQTTTPPDPTVVVKDSWKYSYSNVVLGIGKEKRKGKTRLQGYYGGMLMFGIGGNNNKYTYGNPLKATSGTRHDFGLDNLGNDNSQGAGKWVTEDKAGATVMLGIRGFCGAEYFIFPKIAVGAEFGWGLGVTSQGDGQQTTEFWDAAKTPAAVASQTTKTGGKSTFGIDTDVNGSQMIPAGTLTLTMHF
ncbi:MAG: hypothetical protein HY840_11125 [Bacteroidetes bacterium]|nr:hypothetical protein [Bacteroidota bacterium]